VLVSAQDGYRLWSRSYDRDPNPVVALERRVLRERLGPLSGRSFLDVATGTGYWMNYARLRGARAFGIDLSSEMLSEAASKPGLRKCLIRADMNALPLGDGVADIAVCSLALGYVPSLANLFRELARVAAHISGRVIVTDLHERAVQAGWQRCFTVQGLAYQIEHFEHTTRELDEAAKASGLRIDWRVASYIGEPEREFFVRAGREHAFAEASRVPAILSTCWIRS
jgi:ubiquinone/menaquinone biosynthesis C-methylase UbiE